MKKIKHPKLTSKLTSLDKAIYVYDAIIGLSKEYGRHIPIRIIIKEFSKDEENAAFIISKKEVIKIISNLESLGVINFYERGFV